MCEAEVYSIFYEGANPESKDFLNSSTCGNFTKKRVSEAREILGRLMDAKKAYDSPRNILRRGTVDAVSVQNEDRMDARMDRPEKTLLTALGKGNPSDPAEKAKQLPGPEEGYQYYSAQGEVECLAQVNAVGNWNKNNQNTNWNQWKIKDSPWRDNPCFRWSDGTHNPSPQPHNPNPAENQQNWPNRN